jgi:hypothetical protein
MSKFLLALLALLIASAVSSILTTTAAPANAQSCSHISVGGKATKRDGSALKRYGVFVTLHNGDHALARGRTSRHGGFSLSFCRSKRLRTFASHHNGHLNLDVTLHAWNTRRGYFWVRIFTVPYGASHVAASAHYRPARTVSGRTSSRTASRSLAPETGMPDFGAYVVHPGMMFAEVVPHVHDPYTVSSSSVGSIKATIGVSVDGYGASGSLSVDDSSDFHIDKTLRSTRKHKARAIVVQPALSVTSQYNCYPIVYFGSWPGTSKLDVKCDTTSSGKWTGVVRSVKAKYVPCTQGRTPVVFMNNRTWKGFGIGKGVTFRSEAGVNTPTGGFTVSTQYGAGTRLYYSLDQGGKKHRFCAGGNGSTLTSSSKLYISSRVSSPPPSCRSTTCALKPWEVAFQ